MGIQCIAVNTPCFDEEKDTQCSNHRAFFTNTKNLLIEFLDASVLTSGSYIVELATYPSDTDSFPVVIKAKRILSGKLIWK
jgi:hypothetical protein